jgi:carbon-monoxide dehydrogenase medium subunit
VTEVPANGGLAYHGPESVEDALQLLARLAPDAKPLAGGQSLLVLVRSGLVDPNALIGLKRIPALSSIDGRPDGGLTIGAMVTQHRLEQELLIRERATALAEAAAVVASPPVRRQGTIGGNLCHADPTADPPAALIALGAEVELASLNGRRRLPVEAFFVDYMETAIQADELLVAVHLPGQAPRSGSAYLKLRQRGVDTALVGAGVAMSLAEDGRTCAAARIGLAAAGTTPLRALEAERVLIGRPVSEELLEEAGGAAAEESAPLSDTEASEWYRREMIQVYVRRAGALAAARARESLNR